MHLSCKHYLSYFIFDVSKRRFFCRRRKCYFWRSSWIKQMFVWTVSQISPRVFLYCDCRAGHLSSFQRIFLFFVPRLPTPPSMKQNSSVSVVGGVREGCKGAKLKGWEGCMGLLYFIWRIIVFSFYGTEFQPFFICCVLYSTI